VFRVVDERMNGSVSVIAAVQLPLCEYMVSSLVEP
jgi:hypothetical protein